MSLNYLSINWSFFFFFSFFDDGIVIIFIQL